MQAHGAQSPGEGGSLWGSRTVLLKPGRAGPPADAERGAPRGPRGHTAPPGSPAQHHAGGTGAQSLQSPSCFCI